MEAALKIEISEKEIRSAEEHQARLRKTHPEEAKMLMLHRPWEPHVDWKFSKRVEAAGSTFILESLNENGTGLFDVWYRTEDKEKQLVLGCLDICKPSAAAFIIAAAKEAEIELVGGKLMESKDFEKHTDGDATELVLDFATGKFGEDFADFIILDDEKFYTLGHVSKTMSPGRTAHACKIRPQKTLNLIFARVKNANGMDPDDLITITNIRNPWIIHVVEEHWNAGLHSKELFETEKEENEAQRSTALHSSVN